MSARNPARPLPGANSLRLFDADALTEAVRSSRLEHSQIEQGNFQAELKRVDLGRLSVDSGCYTRKVIAGGDFPPDCVIVGCVLDSREEGCVNGFRFRRHDLIIFPEGAELDCVLPGATTWCTVQLSGILLEEAGCAETVFDRIKVLPGNRPVNAQLVRLLDCLVHSRMPDTAADGNWQCTPSLPDEETLLDQIRRLLVDYSSECISVRRPSLRNRLSLVRRFEHKVRERIDTVIRIPELCTELGASQRTVENLVRDEIGMTPKQFCKVLRLNAIRRELLRNRTAHETIASIAGRNGINHMGRFAADYQRQFGEHPSETIKKGTFDGAVRHNGQRVCPPAPL